MYPRIHNYIVVVVLLVLSAVSHAQDVKNATCESSVDSTETVTLNCSRRHLDELPSTWPEQLQLVSNESNVLIKFFNNSITKVTQLPSVPGARIAITLKNNKIKEIVDDAFKNIPNLVYLDLSSNIIKGEVLRSEIFQGPYENGLYDDIALETLNLGYNEIHSLDRYLFQYTPNLTRLYLNNNPLEMLDYVTVLAIASAVNLEVLDLANTDIDTVPLDALKPLKYLQQIDLSGNKFFTVPESLSLVGGSLEYLNFNNNPLMELNDDSFIGLTNLKALEVGENDNLEEVKRSTFSPLVNLKTLHLCHNKNLKYISHSAFRGLKDKWTIKEIYLDDNNLSELPVDLIPWSKVEVLGMTGNNWLCNCDLADIVTKQGAGQKFPDDEIPFCVAPMKWSGLYVTNVTLEYCPSFDTRASPRKSLSLSSLKPKHILWSIFGVAMVVLVGMLLGLLVNSIKTFYKRNIRTEPIRYINLNRTDSSFA